MVISGAVPLVFGLILLILPGAGALSLVWLIGAYSIALGILLIVLGFRLRTIPTQRAPA